MSDISDTFQQLASFYLGTIQQEGLRRLTLSAGRRGRYFIAPPFDREQFFHQAREEIGLPSLTQRQQSFISDVLEDLGPDTGHRDRLFYGFPTYVDESSKVAPLFFAEVTPERRGGAVVLSRDADDPLYINHHLFQKEGYPPEGIVDIQERIEQTLRSAFQQSLDVALGYLRVAGNRDWRAARPLALEGDKGLQPSPIIFRSAYSPYTYNLEKDLSALQRYRFLQNDADETAIAPYLRPASEGIQGSGRKQAEVLPLNEEQDAAVDAALQEPLSVITGPPGTGKSQVVVNLLAEAALSQQPVLFASKNNKAVDVVRNRLREILGEDYDFVLRLGSRRQMEETRDAVRDRLANIEDRQVELAETYSEARAGELRQAVDAIQGKVAELKRAKRDLEDAEQKQREAEGELPEGWSDPEPPGDPEAIPRKELSVLRGRARALAGEGRLGFCLWFKRLFMGGRLLQVLRDDTEELIRLLPRRIKEDVAVQIYKTDDYAGVNHALEWLGSYRTFIGRWNREQDAKEALRELLTSAADYNGQFTYLKERLSDASQKLFRAAWIGRVAQNISEARRRFRRYFEAVGGVRSAKPATYRDALDELETALERMGAYFPVWVVTNLSVRNALPLRPALFDLVIVDEASQCDVASAVPLLYRAKRSAIIGDPNQLQHITSIDEEEEQQIAQRNGAAQLLPRWSYADQSLYGAAERAARDRGHPPILLRRHYRSHPTIIRFSNRQFYGGRLRGMRSGDSFDVPAKWRGVRWFDVQGSVPEGISSAYNDAEINAVLSLLNHWFEEGLLTRGDLSVGIVTPFRAQADRLEERLRQQDWWGEVRSQLQIERPATVGTAHRFQGDERDLMIFSPVVAPGIKTYTERWVATTDQLLNVAITRARASLQVVGHHSRCRGAGGALGEFATYVARYGLVPVSQRGFTVD